MNRFATPARYLLPQQQRLPSGRLTVLLALAGSLLLPGCYYMQAARGQLEVLHKREPVEDVIAAAETPGELARRLSLLRDARQFAVDELGLPDNDSYRTYSELDRDYVVWNVFATPEFSLTPKTWCYPIVGCVSYRGYFSEDRARRQAKRLAERGYDVAVGGVAAYSTLGRFDDPILSTMMRWDDVRIVSTLFHELAHQVIYVKNDTGFNESFATAVEEIGIERWLDRHGRAEDMSLYRAQKRLQQNYIELVNAARKDLNALYHTKIGQAEMRNRKQARLTRLRDDIEALLRAEGRNTDFWLTAELNNARLVPVALYEGRVPAFLAIYRGCGSGIECFYREVGVLSELSIAERNARLDALEAGDTISRVGPPNPNGTDLSDFLSFRGSGILPRLFPQSRLEGPPTRRASSQCHCA